jgi:hypothetical protein
MTMRSAARTFAIFNDYRKWTHIELARLVGAVLYQRSSARHRPGDGVGIVVEDGRRRGNLLTEGMQVVCASARVSKLLSQCHGPLERTLK